jgi:hypothetical protein
MNGDAFSVFPLAEGSRFLGSSNVAKWLGNRHDLDRSQRKYGKSVPTHFGEAIELAGSLANSVSEA